MVDDLDDPLVLGHGRDVLCLHGEEDDVLVQGLRVLEVVNERVGGAGVAHHGRRLQCERNFV